MADGRRYVIRGGGPPGPRLDYARELNPGQLAAVTAGCGATLCIAGAGTGKTRTVTYRVAWLIEQGVPPDQILLCTFTNRAAREMLKRVDALTGGGVTPSRQSTASSVGGGAGGRVLGGTFHHVANVLLRRHADRAGLRESYGILDDGDAEELVGSICAVPSMKSALGDAAAPPKPGLLLTVFGLAANTMRPLEEIVIEQWPYLFRYLSWMARVRDAYEARKRELNVTDFDGLLTGLRDLLATHPAVRAAAAARFRHVLVDEYQDTTRLQGEIVCLLAGGGDALAAEGGRGVREGRGMMVVGDDAQSIYSFRGATVSNMLEFPARYPGCAVVTLARNYRSTPQVLALANRVLARNRDQFHKILGAERGDGPLPAFIPVRDGDEQAAFVAQRVADLVDEGVGLAEIAVLYRAHSHSLELQLALARREIPFIVRSGMRFLEQAHIKDALSLLRFVGNPRDELSSGRLLKLFAGIGSATAAALARAFRGEAAGMPDAAAAPSFCPDAIKGRALAGWRRFQAVIGQSVQPGVRDDPAGIIAAFLSAHYGEVLEARYPDARSRRDDLEQLAAFASRFKTLADFLNDIALLSTLEADQVRAPEEGEREFLTLSSVHQAKGLEWRAVFVVWLADGRFPSALSLKTLAGEEEERRLFYVAITRAKDELYLCQPMSMFTRDREMKILHPSRFVSEMDGFEGLVERWTLDLEGGPEG